MSDINTTGTVSISQDYTNNYRNQMQESLIDAINILYKGAVAKENISKTLECIISDASERDKGIYKVDYMKNIFEVSCPLSTLYDVGDAVFVLVPDGDFSKTKIIVGSAEGNTGGSSGTDVEANPTGTATDILEKLRVGTTIYSVEGGSTDVVTDVKVNGASVVGSDHVARISAVTQAQLENALETKADATDLTDLEETVNDLITTVSGKANQSSLEALTTIVRTKANSADVNAALNLKANQSDLNDLTTIVDSKANQNEVTAIKDGAIIDSFGDVENALTSKQDTLAFDNVPTQNSNNPVTSGGIYSALINKVNSDDIGTAAEKDYIDSVTKNSTDLVTSGAVYTAIDNLPEPMVFKGSLGTGGTVTTLPVDGSATIGDTYKVITAGTYVSQTAKVGDTFICDSKTSSANTWVLIPSGDEPSGTVTSVTLKATSPIAIDSSSAITTSGTRTLSHANSGATAGSYGDSGNQTPGYGSTFKVPYVTVNATGHVTAISEHTVKIPASDNTNTTYAAGTGTTITGSNNAINVTYGSAANTACQGNDSRLSNARQVADNVLTNQDLNSVMTPGFYSAGGGNSVSNKPSGVDHFGLLVIHGASGQHYIQIIYAPGVSKSYRRFCTGGTTSWSSWTEEKITDNNTTYTFANGTNGFKVTPSGGSAQTVSVTPSFTVTTGDSNGQVKVNGTNASVKGLGSAAYTSNDNIVYKNTDIPEGSANLSATATTHKITTYRNGLTIPYQMDNTNDGGIIRCRGTSESNCIFEMGTWDDSGGGETIQFNYYPTTSQVTPTYSVEVPKKSGTIALTSDIKTYTAATATPGAIAASGSAGSSTNYARQDHTHAITVATGDSNGQVKIAGQNASVKGLGSAAYTASTAYAAASHTHNYAGSSSAGGAANSLANFKVTNNTNLGIDDPGSNAIGYVSGLTKAAWNYQQTDGALYTQRYSDKWIVEMFQDYRTGQVSVRGKNNGTWQGWRNILDSSNYASYVTPAGIGAAPASHTHTISQVTWGPGQNLTTSATANGQEWSIDLTPGSYTGTYFHVWSSKNSKSILCCYPDDNSVTIPNGSLNVSGTIKQNGTAVSLNGHTHSYLPLSGGTMTGQILTSFKSAVAMGSRQADATTIENLCSELRYSSGCAGSVSISAAYTKNNITIPAGWYNYLWMPHRSGGSSGSASGDNCNYGSLLLSGMTLSGCYMIRYSSSAISELKNLYANTTYTASTTSVGSASAGTAIAADDITAWSAGTMTSASYSKGVLTITNGSAPSLSYTARSIPNISVSNKTVVTGITAN